MGIVPFAVSLFVRNLLGGMLGIEMFLFFLPLLPGVGRVDLFVEVEALLLRVVSRRGVALSSLILRFLTGVAVVPEAEIPFLMLVRTEGVVVGMIVVVLRLMVVLDPVAVLVVIGIVFVFVVTVPTEASISAVVRVMWIIRAQQSVSLFNGGSMMCSLWDRSRFA